MKMASALPTDSGHNGMDQVRDLLLQYPDRPIIAVVVLDCESTMTHHKKHTRVPTISVLHIEPMVDAVDHHSADRLLRRAYLARTAEQLELPLDFNVPQREDPFQSRPSRWRPIDTEGRTADALAEPPDDPEPEADKDDETGPPEVDMDAAPDTGEGDAAVPEEVDPDAEKTTTSDD
jgi:hypothetical protein